MLLLFSAFQTTPRVAAQSSALAADAAAVPTTLTVRMPATIYEFELAPRRLSQHQSVVLLDGVLL
jgi:hypothetical protein